MLDLAPGTKVVIVNNHGWRDFQYAEGVVERQTTHHVVLKNGTKFRRRDRRQVGDGEYQPTISTNPDHFKALAEQPTRNVIRRLKNGIRLRDITQAEIVATRAAFDKIEVLMRELGEWEEP